MLGTEFENIVGLLSRLPGMGKRSARRVVLHLLSNKDDVMLPLAESLRHVAETVTPCPECHTLDTATPCQICANTNTRDQNVLCVVETVADLWALERTGSYKGLYHVLGGTLSALDGIDPDDLYIPHLKSRILEKNITELIIALNATIDGQTTAHYIADTLAHIDIKITRLARGVPMGSALDYLDDNTLITALNARSNVS